MAAMEPTHASCKQMLDCTGKVVAPPANARVHEVRIPGLSQPLHMYLIGGNDIVSDSLAGAGWEGGHTAFILERLAAQRHTNPLFVDIGANVGTHAIHVAAAGFRTLAVEAAPTNQALLRATYCANQQALSKLTLVGTALGSKTQTCSVWAPSINTGNGMMYCGGKRPPRGSTMVRLGNASTMRLDGLLTEL